MINLDIAQSMGRAVCIEIDAKFVGNESRFINDYRGISPKPNVEFCTKADAQKGIWVTVKSPLTYAAGKRSPRRERGGVQHRVRVNL